MKNFKIFVLILIAVSLSLRGMSPEGLNENFLKAVESGNLEDTKVFLAQVADINIREKNLFGDIALIIAAKKGFIEIVKLLLADPRVDINAANLAGGTALIGAATEGHTEIVKLLLDQRDPRVNIHVTLGRNTALTEAAAKGNVAIVKLLLNADADLKPAEVYKYMTFRYKNNALIDAAENGHIEIVRILLEKGAEVSAVNPHGNTALMEAAKKGHFEIASLLIKARSDVNKRAYSGNTALILAVKRGNIKTIRLLLKSGAHVNTINTEGNTALVIATKGRNVRIISLLLNAMSKKLNERHDSKLNKLMASDIRKSLTEIGLYGPNSIELLKAFHMFARRHSTEFPWLEKDINQLMNRALAYQYPETKEEAFERIMRYQRTSR